MSQKLFENAESRYQIMSDRLDGRIEALVSELEKLLLQSTSEDDSKQATIKKLDQIRLDFNKRVETCIPKHFSVPRFQDD
jgi:hypothetical protein